jgi:hypothetical protein
VPNKVADWLTAAIPLIRDYLVKPETTGMNVTEWAKKPRCWDRLLEKPPVIAW